MRRLLCGLLLLCVVGFASAASAPPPPPPDLNARVGYDQNLGASIPEDLHFVDSNGRSTTLAQLAHDRPLLLALGYYRCPNLCDMVLNGLADAATKLTLRPGKDYEIVFLSIDPREKPDDAAAAMQRLALAHPAADLPRWHLLTGEETSIHALAKTIGFRYFYDASIDQYAHAAGAVLLTSAAPPQQAKVAQYFFGVAFPAATLRLALVDASRGQLGSLIDQLVLLCCGYDPTTGRYSLLIGRVMQVLGVGFALVFAAWLLWVRRSVRSAA